MPPHVTPFFPENLDDYASWVAKYGLVAPYGKCQCGCGGSTWIATKNDKKYFMEKGQPVRFLRGHFPKRQIVLPSPCSNCGRVKKHKVRGECATCYNHRRKYGAARPPDRPEGNVRGPDSPNWKGDAAARNTKRKRAHVRYALGPCELCGKPGVDRHHRDDDTGNNEPSNIMILCRRCHMQQDGRLDRFKQNSNVGKRKLPTPCVNCGRLITVRRLGRCGACREYLKRHGKERPK